MQLTGNILMAILVGNDGLCGARPFPDGDIVSVNYLFIHEIVDDRTAGFFILRCLAQVIVVVSSKFKLISAKSVLAARASWGD